MSPHFTLGSFIIPFFVFIFSLYIAAVPKELSHRIQKSNKRVILCGLGIAVGLYCVIATLVYTKNNMTALEGHRLLYGLSILSWSLYSLFTNHSNLSKVKKIAKVIIYWLITALFLSIPNCNEFSQMICLLFGILILTIIAFYTVCDRVINEKISKKENRYQIKKRVKIPQKCHFLYQLVRRRITLSFNLIWQCFVNNKKIILIIVAIIVFLWFLPYYTEYFINNSGLYELLKYR